MRAILIFVTVVSVLVPFGTPSFAVDSQARPLAVIGNRAITEKDLDERIQSLPAKVREMYDHPQGREELLQEMVRTEIFAREAEAQGLTKDKAIQAKIQDLRKTFLAAEYTKRHILSRALVTEAEALRHFESNREQFKQPEQIKAPSLFIKVSPSDSDDVRKEKKSKAAALLARARAGEDFMQLVSSHSERPFKDDSGFFKRGRLAADIETTVFALKPGELTPLLEVEDGLIFFKLFERKPEQALSFAEVKQGLLQDLSEKKIRTLFESEEKRLQARYNVSYQKLAQTSNVNPNQSEPLQGRIVEIIPLEKNGAGKSQGTVMIEDKRSGGMGERIAVSVHSDTEIVRLNGGKEQNSSYNALRQGQTVSIVTQGPSMQSYPPQTRARRIVIQENN